VRQISFYEIPKSMNEDKDFHWGKQAKIKKQWQEMTEDKIGTVDKTFNRAKVEIHIFFPIRRKRDIQNYMGCFAVKGILDGLVTSRLLSEDNFEVIKPYIKFHIDKRNPRTEVRVYEYKD